MMISRADGPTSSGTLPRGATCGDDVGRHHPTGVVVPPTCCDGDRVEPRHRRAYRGLERRRRTTVKKILVGTDTSAAADLAVREAARLALADPAGLRVTHARP